METLKDLRLYEKMYFTLFNDVTKAVKELQQKNYIQAETTLKNAQCKTEEIYVSEGRSLSNRKFTRASLRKTKNVYDHLVSPSSDTACGGATFPREGEGSNTGTCLTTQ